MKWKEKYNRDIMSEIDKDPQGSMDLTFDESMPSLSPLTMTLNMGKLKLHLHLEPEQVSGIMNNMRNYLDYVERSTGRKVA